MRWHLETWRKLYVAKSPAWLRLPVSARGLGRELLTYCDDAGRIDVGTDKPGEAVAYLLGARPKEHKRIAEDVKALLDDGYLVHSGTDLVVRNFVPAQDRTPAAKRTAEWRARKNEESRTEPSPGDAAPTTCGDVTRDILETSREPSPETETVRATRSVPTRSVPTRVEGETTPASPGTHPARVGGSDPNGPPERGATAESDLTDTGRRLLELARGLAHLRPIATVRFADNLAGRILEGTYRLEQVETGLRDLNDKLALDASAGLAAPGKQELVDMLRGYIRGAGARGAGQRRGGRMEREPVQRGMSTEELFRPEAKEGPDPWAERAAQGGSSS